MSNWIENVCDATEVVTRNPSTTQTLKETLGITYTLAPYELLFIVVVVIIGLKLLHPYLSYITLGWIKVQTVAQSIADTHHDTRVRDLCEKEVNIIDYETKRRMRDAARRTIMRTIAKYPHAEEVLLRGRVAISTAICDNHITYDLKRNAEGYIVRKIEEVSAETYRPLTADEHEAVIYVVVHWVFDIMAIQRRAIDEKLKSYAKAMHDYRLDRFKETLQARIDKNHEYLEAIARLLDNADSVIIREEMLHSVGSRLLVNADAQSAQIVIKDNDPIFADIKAMIDTTRKEPRDYGDNPG